MTFAWPHLLWLLALPAALLVFEFSRRGRAVATDHAKILRAEAAAHSLRLLGEAASPAILKRRRKPWLYVGLAFAIAAAARPQWGRLEEPVFDQAREILIAIDLSRSMLTPDVKPSRLERAKLLTQSLLEKLAGERVGLVVFSGTAFLQSPLSADYEILREFLPALNPEFLPEGGTNYRALIDTAITAFGSTAASDRFIIILSDGEATSDDWRDRVSDLKKKGIRVIGLGVGTAAGAMIPDGNGGLVKDERGAVVLSKLESGTLRALADETGGLYSDASNWIDLAALVSNTVETGKKGQFTEKNTVRLVERFQWPLGFALWCVLVSFYYEFPVRPKPRDLKLSAPAAAAKKVASTTVALLVLGFGLGQPRRAKAAEAAPETTPMISRIVGRIAQSPSPTARDWAELSQETVSWGSKLQSSQQPVPPGPIVDALSAVELGSKEDPKTADWPKLRDQLEALLKKPDEQKQDQKNDEQKQDQQQPQDQKDQKQDQQKQDKPQEQPQQKSDPNSSPQDKNSSKDNQPNQNPPPQKQNSGENQSAFGDMKDHEKAPTPPPQETQQVGGAPKKPEGESTPVDPSLALPLQKLEQLRNQDSPAELFKLIEGERDPTPRKKTKDW
jgi:Ca-activated chloride channel family protein